MPRQLDEMPGGLARMRSRARISTGSFRRGMPLHTPVGPRAGFIINRRAAARHNRFVNIYDLATTLPRPGLFPAGLFISANHFLIGRIRLMPMSAKKLTLSELKRLARTIPEVTQKVDRVRVALEAYGYDRERISRCTELLYQFEAAESEARSTFARQLLATQTRDEARKSFYKRRYKAHLDVARTLIRDSALRSMLRLGGRLPKSFPRFVKHAENFYAGVEREAEVREALAEAAISGERLLAVRQELADLAELGRQQTSLIAAQRRAYRRAHEHEWALREWIAAFHAIARAALIDTPDLGAPLGLKVRRGK
jgi:hypothetical protein